MRCGKFLFGVTDAALERIDLGTHCDQLDLAALRHHRTIRQFGIESCELVLLVLQCLFGAAHRFSFDAEFLFGGAQLFLDRLLARFERKDRGVLFTKLELHAIDRIGFLAEFGELAGGLVLELVDAHLQPPRRHREFRAQLVLVGLDFGHRQGSRTARLCTSGRIISPNSIEIRKPIARYMIGSIMNGTPREKFYHSQCHGGRAKGQPIAALT